MNLTINFHSQQLKISNDIWDVHLTYQDGNAENLIRFADNQNLIFLNDIENPTSYLKVETGNREFLITGIDGGFYLHGFDELTKSYIAKLTSKELIMSLGFTFFSFDLDEGKIKWKIRPDTAEVFEFYDIENDYLVRGEMQIHRIDQFGNVKWSFSGRDIWVNLDGKKEVQIVDENIFLVDFEGNEYTLNFSGELLEDKPKNHPKKQRRKWWNFWGK